MRKFIFAIAVFGFVQPNMANAQNNRPVQRKKAPTTTVRKTPPVKSSVKSPEEDVEYKRLMQKRDSLEALYDDLQKRWVNAKGKETIIDEHGTEYQVDRAVMKGSVMEVYLRARNKNKPVELNFELGKGCIIHSKVVLDNGYEKKEFGNSNVFIGKGYWCVFKLFTLFNIKTLPKPKVITSLMINEQNLSSPIVFNNIPIIQNN